MYAGEKFKKRSHLPTGWLSGPPFSGGVRIPRSWLAVATIGTLLTVGLPITVAGWATAAYAAGPSPTLYVSTSGSDGNGCTTVTSACQTIQHALQVAYGVTYSGETVTIDLAAGTYFQSAVVNGHSSSGPGPVGPGTGPPAAPTAAVVIQGAGSSATVLDDEGAGTVLTVDTGLTATVSGLTITGGVTTAGGSEGGGGVANFGNATFTDDSISGNSAPDGSGGGVISYPTGSSGGNLTLADDTISGNTAGFAGGGVLNGSGGNATLTNNTISENSAGGYEGLIAGAGGGVFNGGNVMLSFDTISGNSAGSGGGVYSSTGAAMLSDSLLAANGGGDCDGAVGDGGYDVADDSTCNLGPTSVSGSSSIGPLSGSANGSTGPETEAITSASSAFDEVPLSACTTVTTDERGEPRPGNGFACDAGSFELQEAIHATTTTLTASPDPANVGQQVTYTATVMPAPTGGGVAFTDNGTPIAACANVPVRSGGVATCLVTYAAQGSHQVVSTYGGYTPYLASTSSTIGETIANCGSSYKGCNLQGTDLAGADLAGANLQGDNLQSTDLQGANLQSANLQGDNMQNSDLAGADLAGSNLQGDNLQGVGAAGADLAGANLQGTNLQNGNFSHANLAGADLQGDNMQGANLTGANLDGTNVSGANLQSITWSDTTCPDGTNSDNDGGTCLNDL